MAKIVVVDGLARSGTTLISSIIHSQEGAACYRGVFHEMLACNIGQWSHDYAIHPMMEKSVEFSTKQVSWYQKLQSDLCYLLNRSKKDYRLNYPMLVENTLNALDRRAQYDLLGKETWESILSVPIESFDGLDELYQNLASTVDVEILAFRWNQGLAYINNWLRNPDHYWISVIRNPMDRALSSFKAFNQSYDDSVKCTVSYVENLSKIFSANHYTIYYEDLILNPEEEIKKMFQFLGKEINEVNYTLKKQSGAAYKIETSDLVGEGKSHTEGKVYEGFDKNMINKHKDNLEQSVIDTFSPIIQRSSLLSRYKNGES